MADITFKSQRAMRDQTITFPDELMDKVISKIEESLNGTNNYLVFSDKDSIIFVPRETIINAIIHIRRTDGGKQTNPG